MSDLTNIIPERVCPMCGRTFIAAPLHAYKDKNKRVLYCSYHCYNHRNDNKKADGRAKPIEKCSRSGEVLETYVSAKAAAEQNNWDPQFIRDACRTGKMYRGFLWRYKE